MATLSPGNTVVVSLPAGSTLFATGQGTAALTPLSSATRLHPLTLSQQQIGPVAIDRTALLTADAGGIGVSYRVTPVLSGVKPLLSSTGRLLDESGVPILSDGRKNAAGVPFKVGGAVNAPSGGVVGVTQALALLIPFYFTGVRLHALNVAAVAQVNCLMSAAVSTSIADCVTPTSAAQAVLFAGTQAFSTTAATVTTVNQWVWTDKAADMLTLRALPRADGGAGYPLFLRLYTPAAGNTVAGRYQDYATAVVANLETLGLRCFFRAGDCVTTPGNMTAGNATEWQAAMHIMLEFQVPGGQSVFLPIGDSTMQGQDGASQIIGPSRKMVNALNANGSQVAYLNGSHSSMTAALYLQNGLTLLDTYKPAVSAFCPWSPNGQIAAGDEYTQAGVDLALSYASTYVTHCKAAGTRAILRTPDPVGGLNAAQEAFRRAAVADVKAICATGAAILVDTDAIYTDYSTNTGGWIASLNANTVHPNEAGQVRESALWASVVAPLLQ